MFCRHPDASCANDWHSARHIAHTFSFLGKGSSGRKRRIPPQVEVSASEVHPKVSGDLTQAQDPMAGRSQCHRGA